MNGMGAMGGMDPQMMQMMAMLQQRGGQSGGMPGMGMPGAPSGQQGMQGGFGSMQSMSQQMPQIPEPAPPPVANLGLSPGASTQQFGQGMPQYTPEPSPLQQQFAAQQQMTQPPQSGMRNWWDKNQGNVSQGLFALSNIL